MDFEVYVTSWARYNEGEAGKFITISNDMDNEDLRELLIKEGFDLDGRDEEMVIHDWMDGDVFKLGECSPWEALEIIECINDEDDLMIYKAIAEEHGEWTAREALNTGFENYMFIKGGTARDYKEEMVKDCDDIPDYISKYIDWDQMAEDDDSLYENEDGLLVSYL